MLNEIVKGMDNAAEKINENFMKVETRNIGDDFTLEEATDIIAYSFGNLIFLSFRLLPKTGWNTLTGSELRPVSQVPLVLSKNSSADLTKNAFGIITLEGKISIYAGSTFDQPLYVSATYIKSEVESF